MVYGRSCTLLPALVVSLVLAAAPPCVFSQQDLVDSTGTAGQYDPRMGVDGQGNMLAVWQDYREGSLLRSAYRPGGGPWEPSVPVDPSSTAYQGIPGLVMDAAGHGYAVWEDRRGDFRHIRFAYRSTGGAWGPSEVVSPSSERQLWPALAGNRQGDLVAAWTQDEPGGQYHVHAALRHPGQGWGPAERVTDVPGAAHTISVAMDAAGGAYAVWKDGRSGTDDLYFSARLPAGGWTSNVRVNEDIGGADLFGPDLTADDDGDLYAVWSDMRTGVEGIYFCHRPAGGSWGPDERVSDDTGGQWQWQRNPSVAILADGYIAVVWVDWRNPSVCIYGAGRSAGGTWGDNVLLREWGVSSAETRVATVADPATHGMFASPRLLLLHPLALVMYYAMTLHDVVDAPPYLAVVLAAALVSAQVAPDEVFLQTGDAQQFLARLFDIFGFLRGGREPIEPTWTATGGDLSTTTGFSTEYTAGEVGEHVVIATVTYELEGGQSAGTAGPRLTITLADTSIVHVAVRAQRLDPTPAEFTLSQNHPNPVRSRTSLEFGVPEPCRVVLGIYDATGREIVSVLDGDHESGTYRVDLECASMTPGVYLYRMSIGGRTASRAMVVTR